jgi:molybdate transport system substrate-binding protein
MKSVTFIASLIISIQLHSQTIRIAAAADLRYAMDEIVKSYKSINQEINIEINYGSSGNTYTQIVNGASFDMFFSADIKYTKMLTNAGLTLSEPKLYAIGRIVLWSATIDVSRGFDVFSKKTNIKIAIANPIHAPYGQRAVESLKYYKLYEKVEKQLILGENVSQAAQFCISGNAEVGIIALSLALSPSMSNFGKYTIIDDKSHTPLEQAYVILKNTKEQKAVFAFSQFIASKNSRVIFEKYGFIVPQH